MKKALRLFALLVFLLASLFGGRVNPVDAFSYSATVNMEFSPSTMVVGETVKLIIKIYNPNEFILSNVSFTDSLIGIQSGLVIASPSNLSNDCGGVVIAQAGTTTIALSGGTVEAKVLTTNGTCTISVDVTSTTPGSLENGIPAYGGTPTYGGVGLYSTARGGLDIITNSSEARISLLVSGVESPTMDKNFSPTTVWVGQSSQLEINIHNNDATTSLTQATFTDTLPNSFTVAAPLTTSLLNCGAGTLSTSVGSNSITLNNATIAPNTVCRVRVRVVSNTQGEYANTINAGPSGAGSLHTQQGVYNTSSATANINVQAVGILKSFSPTTIQKGDSSLMTITLRNPTGAAYQGVNLVDDLPSGLIITGTTASSQCGGIVTTDQDTISLANGVVPAGSVASPGTCTIVARVTSNTAASYTNTIHAGDVSGPLQNIFEVSATLTVQPRTIGVVKSFGSAFTQGGTTSLTIVLQNRASTTLTGVQFTDDMPTNMKVVGTPTASASCGGSAVVTSTSTSVSLSGAVIPPGTVNSPGTCTVYATVTSAVSGSFTNPIPQGAVTSTQGVTNNAVNGLVTSYSIGGNATVSKTFATSPISTGSPTRLQITINSPDDIGLSNISIVDNLPGDMVIMGTPEAAANPTTTCGGSLLADIGSNVIHLTGGTISSPRGSCTITVYVTALTPGTKTNSIPGNTLSSAEGRTDPNNRSASVEVTSFSVDQSFSPNVVSPGGLSRLTISLINSSMLPITGVTLTDLLSTMAISGDSSGDKVVIGPDNGNITTTCGGTPSATTGQQTISLSAGTIPASDGLVPGLCTISVDVQGLGRETPTGTPRTNTILRTNVSGTIAGKGTVYPVANSTKTLAVTGLTIEINKKFSPTTVFGGSASQMQITIKNLNDVPLSDISFTDTMPAGMILADPVNFDVGTCGGTLVKNSINKFTYSGGSLPKNTNCVITVNTTMTVVNNLVNVINGGDVTTYEGATNADLTSATLTNLSGVSITKAFSPNPIPMGTYSLLTITINNQNDSGSPVLTGIGLTDNLPAGLTIAGSPAAETTCIGTSLALTAEPDTQMIKLENAELAPQTSCTIVVPVTSNVPNSYENIIPPGDLTEIPAEDTLVVTGFSLGNRVWNDNGAGGGILNNGIRDGSEPGLSGVTINLYQDSAGDGTPDGASIKTTTTDSNGYYRFDNLIPDTYLIEAVTPSGYITSTVKGGDPDTNAADNDNNAFTDSGTSVFSAPVTIEATPGEPTGESDPSTNPAAGESGDLYSNRTVDFGFFKPYAIGNRVWNDNGAGGGTANNGLLDGSELGFSNIRVNLLSGAGSFIEFTTTDTNGYYRFDNLAAGTYIIEIISPLGYTSSPIRVSDPETNSTDNDNNGATVSGNTIQSGIITLGSGASEPVSEADPLTNPLTGEPPDAYSNRTIDFGLVSTYSLGNRVWDDNGTGTGGIANDGLRNGSEPGLSGVTVNLYKDSDDNGTADGAAIATTITDGNGYYRFDDLLANTYIVEVVTPSGYSVSAVNAGDADTTQTDNDNNGSVISGSNILSNPVTLGPGASEPTGDNDPTTNPGSGEAADAYSNRTVDFGFFHLPYSIGNRVWSDLNANGVFDTGELGLANVPVRIFRDSNDDGVADGYAIGSVLTSSTGYYRFDNLIADTYIIEVATPVGYVINSTNGGDPDNNTDLDNNGVVIAGSNIRSNPVTLGPGAVEPTAETDPVTNPESGEALDAYSNRTVDFAFEPLASIGNLVWNDLNDNGTQDASEPGFTGVTVNLYKEGGVLAGTTTTGAGGNYSFINLTPGNYYLVFTRVSGYVFAQSNVGDDSKDSDAVFTLSDDATAQTAVTTLDPGENDTSWDAGMYQQRAKIGDYVWNDINRDGIQDLEESGLGSVTVNLYRPNYGPDGIQFTSDDDLAVATTTTAGSGAYSFTELIPGDYYLVFMPPSGYAISPKDAGSDDSVDSDADVSTGQTLTTTLIPGENELTWDAGLYQLAALGDRVWRDNDRNGVQDGGEPGINGLTVDLYQPGVDGIVNNSDDVYVSSATTTTVGGVTGSYKFKDLVPGDYYLVFSIPTGYALTPIDQGSDDTLDSDADVTTGVTTKITLVGGDNDLKWDAGLFQLASIGDRVWNDLELVPDGIQDAGEPGINGVTVKLYKPGTDNTAGTSDDVLVATTTTSTQSAAGTYQFTNLIPDQYFVVVTPPSGYGFTLADQGADDSVDSDANPADGIMPIVTLSPGVNDPSWDAGIYQLLSSIGNLVWEDLNGNGLQDLPGETGIPDVTVKLYRPGYGADGITGTSDDSAAVATTTTNVNGLYSFTNLTPGYYNLGFTTPSGYLLTLLNQGSDLSKDSDAIPPSGGTVVTLLDPGENDTSWDVGYVQPASLGDFVWHDLNANGVQDTGELGISGVKVDLYRDESGFGLVATTTTDTNGAYSFTNLLPANYYLVFTKPTGYVFTPANAGVEGKDSDAEYVLKNDATARTVTAALNSGENDLDWDAGFYQYAAIGDKVWTDTDADGVQDSGETGLSGVTVTLHNVSADSDSNTTTDSSGLYSFTGLVPGDYYVTVTKPSGYLFSPLDVGTDTTDSDANLTTGRMSTTTLISNETDNTWDAGLYQLASIGDFVWVDTNGNGLQDDGATGLQNVTVTLYNGANVSQGSTTTDANGAYSFSSLTPGDYYVVITRPGSYRFALSNQGSDDTLDSDATYTASTDATARTATTTLISNENDTTWDTGLYLPASISNYVWVDTDGDGIQDAGESGLNNVTVTLYNSLGVSKGSTTTDATGAYVFANLIPGDYYLIFTKPSGYAISPADRGSDDSVDSDPVVATGRTATTSLVSAEDDNTWDAGMYQPASLGNFIWNDSNANGIQDTGELGINSITVRLYRPGFGPDGIAGNADDGSIVTSTTTNSSGAYSFGSLIPGDYYVIFVKTGSYIFSPIDQGSDDAKDSDADTTSGQTAQTNLVSGENDLNWDGGMYLPATIGNFVWTDSDADGVQDAGETGISGVTVTLHNVSLGSDTNATTNASGGYSFTGLVPGDYYITVTKPSGYLFSPLDASGNDGTDSDANLSTGLMSTTTLTSGETDNNWDAGLYQLAAMGNFLWVDTNGNGTQDAGEPGLDGVNIDLYRPGFGPDGIAGNADDNTIVTSTTTSGGGAYSFTGLTPSSYFVDFTLPTGYQFTLKDQGSDLTDSDVTRTGTTQGQTSSTALTSNETDNSWDAGVYQPASIGDYVWVDTDGDGVQDGGEPGLNNVTVTLYNGSGVSQGTATTNSSGAYSFTNLIPGNYYLNFAKPTGYSITTADQGGNDLLDSDPNTSTGNTSQTALTSNENDMTWDAGMYLPATLGDFVWNDLNANGVQDGGETGISGVTATLYTGAGVLKGTTTTNASGIYSFASLLPGDYYVVFTRPGSYGSFTLPNVGADTTDSDAVYVLSTDATAQTATTTLVSGETDSTWDAGFYQFATIGDLVWTDMDADGVQDGGTETGLNGVTVTLHNVSTGSDTNTTTNSSGLYSFTGLVPGDYYVTVTKPSGYLFSPLDVGTDTADSDANLSTGKMSTTTLTSGETDNTWDAGLYQLASIGDIVWVDTNGDGIQNGLETGLSGVSVGLYQPGPDGTAGTVDDISLTSTITGVGGAYSFTGLTPASYFVKFTLIGSYKFTLRDLGGNDALDSDANTSTGLTAITALVSNENDTSWDAGVYLPVAMGDRVWVDTNANGVQDAEENGLGAVTVKLYWPGYGPDGIPSNGDETTAVATKTTASDGTYSFGDLIPGNYYVIFTLPGGYQFSLIDQGGDDALDSDANSSTGKTATTALDASEVDNTWDAGVYQYASLGDLVWVDKNANGLQDTGETGLSGVKVDLYSSADTYLNTTNSNSSGIYSFTNLVPGDYYLLFHLPSGFSISPVDQLSDDAKDSDADTITLKTSVTTLVSAETDQTWDAGMYQSTSLGDLVWLDVNGNGVQDGGLEIGIADVTVDLYSGTGDFISTTKTSSTGAYSFSGLTPGQYFVAITPPSGYSVSPHDLGANDAVDNDVDSATNRMSTTDLTSNENDLTWDAGLYQPAAIGDFVWVDVNGDGIQNASEPPLDSVLVNLFRPGFGADGVASTADDAAVVASASTDANGLYHFTNLIPGDYYLVFTAPSDYLISPADFGADGVDSDAASNGKTANTSLISAEVDDTWDAGMYLPAALGDLAWTDSNGNGIQDSSEPGANGVTVNLYRPGFGPDGIPGTTADNSSIVATTVTASKAGVNGIYGFSGLIPGTYYLDFIPPAGLSFAPADQGSDDEKDSDPNPANGLTISTTLASDAEQLYWDAGFNTALASLGNFVWLDNDGNGVQNAGETGINGVTVKLFTATGKTPLLTTTTTNGGYYSFTDLEPGEYILEFDPPAGYSFTASDQGGNDTNDSDANPATHRTGIINLSVGEHDISWDTGLSNALASFGNFVWLDINENNIQDAEEVGVDGVKVDLYTSAGVTPLKTTNTSGGGYYAFTGLTPGDYYAAFNLPNSGYFFSQANVTSNDEIDSDASPVNGKTATVTLAAGEEDISVDDGMTLFSKIGLAKRLVGEPVSVSLGTWDVTFEYLIKNYGTTDLLKVQVEDNLRETFPDDATFVVQSISSTDFAVNNLYNGESDIRMLKGTDTLAIDDSGILTMVVRVVPNRATHLNSATATGEDEFGNTAKDVSDDGTDPDGETVPDGDPSDDDDKTPVYFGAEIFDPPSGVKTVNDSGQPVLKWTMVWINNTNIVGVHAVVHDPIPELTKFTPSLVDSGYEVPVGAPKDSTSLGVSCTSSTATVTDLCYYEGPTPAYPRGQIVWEGTLGPDLGALTPGEAVNAISITFDITVNGSTRVENNAFIDSDLNGDGDALDDGERSDAKADFIWDVTPGDLPKTGFAPGQINILPYQTTSYAELGDIWLEIPKLDIKMPIVGVPMVNNNWDVSWLGSSAGWLNETAYPTTSGNSVITGHVYLPNGEPGPFVELKKMGWNDKLVIHVGDKQYIYRVRKVMQVQPDDLSPLKTESSSWITLVTCQGYDEKTDSYLYRQVVKAELVEVR